MSRGARLLRSADAVDVRVIVEAVVLIVFTWLALGWTPAATITQYDGTALVAPYFQHALAGGADWTQDLYRFGVVGGSEMHPFAGTMPIVQLCSVLGLSTTATMNAVVIFIQVCFGYFGVKLIAAWIAQWAPAARVRELSAPQRITAIWLCAFAPALGWRLAIGHDNLLLGLLPMLATVALFAAARARTANVTTLVVGWFAVFNGISGLGGQTVMYGAIFGAPIVLVTILGAPRGERWGRAQWAVTAALVAAILVAMPRLIGMIHHAVGEDASRGLGESVTYSFGAASWLDWLTSIPWTKALAVAQVDTPFLVEHNYPLGPLVLFVLIAWPRGAGRGVLWAMIGSVAVAILYADDVQPLSTGLIAVVRPLAAFRAPSRAVLPVLILVAPLALAALWTPRAGGDVVAAPGSRRVEWLAIVVAAAVIVLGQQRAPIAREAIAWFGCAVLAIAVRRRPNAASVRNAMAAIAVVAALGVGAFGERLVPTFVTDTIDVGPRQLHDATLAQAPDLKTALDRVEVSGAPPPYLMSEAFAAQLPTLDGEWYPPKRFLMLLSALENHPVPSTTCVFDLSRTPPFPVLQQLYNVKYTIAITRGGGAIQTLPEPAGPAWFPTRITAIDAPSAMARELSDRHADLHGAVRSTGWVLRSDASHALPLAVDPACATATVDGVATDALGQVARFDVTTATDCPLIVATNYVTTLHASATVGGVVREVAVFPIDIALTGIAVPAGATSIVLEPRADIPPWTWLAWGLGVALLAFAIVASALPARPGARA